MQAASAIGTTLSRVAFVSHGGGPLPVLGDAGHTELVNTLKAMRKQLPQDPSVIIMVSAHWESKGFQITAGPSPSLIYDYHGFPAKSYQIQYPSPGAPSVAEELARTLASKGQKLELNRQRGYDHGVFIPLLLLYPDAHIPVVQISLDNSLDAEKHWEFGAALGAALPKDALLLGSGFSFHNMQAFFSSKSPSNRASIHSFQSWLDETILSPEISVDDAAARWKHWDQAEGATYSHPREEHLIPLIVCHAAAQSQGRSSLPFSALGVEGRHFIW